MPNETQTLKGVLFLCYFFPPTGGAPAQRSLKFVRYLPEEGYRPIVVTQPVNNENRFSPRDLSLSKEIPPSVPVYRVPTAAPGPENRTRRRLERWLGLAPSSGKWWIKSAIELGESTLKSERAELIYASMSPFESAVVAAHLSQKLGIPWVADLRDPWAIDEIQVYPSYLHKRLAQNRMHRLLSTAATVIMNTPEAAAALRRAFPDLKHVVAITNGFDSADFNVCNVSKGDDKFTIVHAGMFLIDSGLPLGWKRRMYELLGGAVPGVDITTRSHLVLFEAIHRWCVADPAVKKDLEILFVGEAPDFKNPTAMEATGLSCARFTGFVAREASLQLVRTADLLFLAMHNMPEGQRARSAPSKLYEYMASGRPILAALPEGDAKDFLAQLGTGYVCRPNDCEGMLNQLRRAYERWKTKRQHRPADQEFLQDFERRNLSKRLAREFDRALACRGNTLPEAANTSLRETAQSAHAEVAEEAESHPAEQSR